MNAEKLMEAINAVEVPSRYRMDAEVFAVLLDAAGGDELRFASYTVRYGFLKGRRAAKAEAKRAAKEKYRREAKKHAPGKAAEQGGEGDGG